MQFKTVLLAISAILVCGITSAQQVVNYRSGSPLTSSAFMQEEDEAVDATELQKEFEKMAARLRELEDDVSEKLSAEKKSAEAIEKANEKLDERLEEIEDSVKDNGKSIGKFEETLPGMVYHKHKSPKMTFFGRLHLDYWAFPSVDAGVEAIEGRNPQDRVTFRRMRIGVSGDLTDNVFYKYEGEFANGAGSTSYRDALMGIKHLPLFNTVIIGNHKRPYNLDQLNSSNHNEFIERPFVGDGFQQDTRRLGISSNGVSQDETFHWRYGVWNHRLTQSSAGYVGDHYQPEFAARLAYMPWYDKSSGGRGYFHLGFAGSVAFPNGRGGAENDARYRARPESRTASRFLDTGRIAGANTSRLGGLEAVLNVGAFHMVGELMTVSVDRSLGFGPNDVNLNGGYIQAAYFLTGEHMPWNRKTATLGRVKPFENFFMVRDCNGNRGGGLGAWQVAARYSWADFNDENIFGGAAESLTLATNWHWNPHTRLQFNYIIGNIDRPGIGEGDYGVVGFRLMTDF